MGMKRKNNVAENLIKSSTADRMKEQRRDHSHDILRRHAARGRLRITYPISFSTKEPYFSAQELSVSAKEPRKRRDHSHITCYLVRNRSLPGVAIVIIFGGGGGGGNKGKQAKR